MENIVILMDNIHIMTTEYSHSCTQIELMGGTVTTSFVCKMHSISTLAFVIVLLANVFSKPPDWLVHEIQDEVTV